jgi:hypothetical protein
MLRLSILSSHFRNHSLVSEPHDNSQPKPVKNLLEKYKAMSNVDLSLIEQYFLLGNLEENRRLNQEFSKIYNNPEIFEKETFEDYTRDEEMIQTNRKLMRVIKEAKLIVPFKDLFSDMNKFISFICVAMLYNENISTKFTVSL